MQVNIHYYGSGVYHRTVKKEPEKEHIHCSKCGKQHDRTTCNCCWIDCVCGTKICGGCGSDNIVEMDIDREADDDAQYWCCLECSDCGLQGCGYCV